MAIQSAITATGIAHGNRRVDNDELGAIVNSSDDWIQRRTGIKARYFIDETQTNWGLAKVASEQALDGASLAVSDLDAIIYATLSPDMAFPGSGVLLQEALGAAPIPALDVRNQCSGFLYGLSVARAWIEAGMYRRILLVGSEVHSTGLDLSEGGRDVAVLFGDGAGAAIVEAVDAEQTANTGQTAQTGQTGKTGAGRIVDLSLGADGAGAKLLYCERPGSQFHPSVTVDDLRQGRHFPKMSGRKVFRQAVERLTGQIDHALTRSGLSPEQVVLVPHQSNQKINELVAQNLGIAADRVVHTIDEFGNTTAASIPMALHCGRQGQQIRRGTAVVLAAFGSGLTWGTAVLQF